MNEKYIPHFAQYLEKAQFHLFVNNIEPVYEYITADIMCVFFRKEEKLQI